MAIYGKLTDLVGKTPIVRLNKITEGLEAEVLVKLEFYNPAASVKDRLALAMIEDAEAKGIITKDTLIIEPTSGNTGIGLAMVCASKGYQLIVIMPENVSAERRSIVRAFGAKVVLTPAGLGMRGAIAEAEKMAKESLNAWIPMQFENESNVAMHKRTTAIEVLEDTNGKVDAFIAGAGTGGTVTGVSSVLKDHNQKTYCVAVEPSKSPVISGGQPGAHKIQGIGAGFIPKVYDGKVIDEVISVDDDDAYETARNLAKMEGILCGISSGANVYAAMQLAKRPEMKGKRIVTIICDTGERYLSTTLFSE